MFFGERYIRVSRWYRASFNKSSSLEDSQVNLDIGNVETEVEKSKKCHTDEIECSTRDSHITNQQCNFTNHITNEGEFPGTEANFTISDTNEYSEAAAMGGKKSV